MMTRLFLFLLLLLPVTIHSQPPLSTSIDVPALTVGRLPSRSGSVVTFDKRVLIVATGSAVLATGNPEGRVCLYINTRTGDLGIRYGESPDFEVCGLNVNDEKFSFALIRPTGDVQTYRTHKKNG